MSKKRILLVFPTAWDRRQLARCRVDWEDRYELLFAEPTDEDCPWNFDMVGYIDRMVEEHGGRIDGVFSSSDYPGATVAGAIATRLGLPGSPPHTIIGCSHKYYSRVAQQRAVPDATPRFALVDPRRPDDPPDLEYPCFIKPVKGAFSVMARRLDSRDELTAFLRRPAVLEFATEYMHLFNQLVAALTDFAVDGGYFLAESLLHGTQVTVEGYALAGCVEIVGIVDSIMHPGTGSFARFDYPSAMRPEIQHRMADIARRAVAGLGLDHVMFNIEVIYEPVRDAIHIIEVNPRICGQFADLYEKVDGVNGYAIALALAAGDPVPGATRRGAAAATSFPLRLFRPVCVRRAPSAADVAAAEALYPGTLVWIECETGQELADFERIEDGQSCRYGIVNVGGASRADLLARLDAVQERLGFAFDERGGARPPG